MNRGGDEGRWTAQVRRSFRHIPTILSWCVLSWCIDAQSLCAQNVDREARRQFDEGVVLLHDGRFAEAIVRFERAQTLREVPAVMFNLALAQRGVGRYVDAERSVTRYLELAQGRLDRAREQEVTRLREEVRAALAHLTLRGGGAGVTVTLDGRVLTESERASALALDPGPHVVEVSGEAVETERFPSTLARGQTLEMTLRPRPRDTRSRLTIEAPADAVVTLDRRPLGSGTQQVQATAGVHEIEVRRAGYETFRTSVTSLARRDERVVVVMRRTAEPRSVLTRWWFWTGVGVVAAGTATAVVYATRPTEPAETGSLRYAVGALVTW